MMLTTNLAVGVFAATGCGMYFWCDQRRKEETRGMAMAVAGMKALNAKKSKEKAEAEAAAAEAARQAEEQKKANSWTNKIKFW
jgi:hypothetical protein